MRELLCKITLGYYPCLYCFLSLKPFGSNTGNEDGRRCDDDEVVKQLVFCSARLTMLLLGDSVNDCASNCNTLCLELFEMVKNDLLDLASLWRSTPETAISRRNMPIPSFACD
jgi:hypothetical protein